MVPQSRQDRNYIISDVLAFQQPLTVQLANVENTVPEPDIVAAKFAFHAKRGLTHIEQHLARKSFEQPENSEAILRHSERHGRIISALQFEVHETLLGGGLAEEVHAGILHFAH